MLTEGLLHIITADEKFILLSNKLILIMVLYCSKFFFLKGNIEIVYFDVFDGNRQFTELIVN